MFVLFGTRFYGRIDACDGCCRATAFFHVFLMPIVPRGSVILLGEGTVVARSSHHVPLLGGESSQTMAYQTIPTKLSWKSLVLGYLRTWWGLLDMFAAIGALVAVGELEQHPRIALVVLLVSAAIVAIHLLLLWVGRLSTNDARKRRVYARYVGGAFDPIDVTDAAARQRIRDELVRFLRARLGVRADAGARDLVRIASDPAVADPDAIGAALTLCRVDPDSAASDPTAAHRALWTRLLAVDSRAGLGR
ncbi:MAG: hypothetical protein KF819_04185 [Labilithrix sp.]|nr:hypothetical protein [Labilithrix sp.]